MTVSKNIKDESINTPKKSNGFIFARIIQFFWCTAFFVGFLVVLYAYSMKQPLSALVAGAGDGKILSEEYLFQVQFPELEVLMDKRAVNKNNQNQNEDDNDNDGDDGDEEEEEEEQNLALDRTPGAIEKFQDILPRREVLVFYYNRFCTADYNTSWLTQNQALLSKYMAYPSLLANTSMAIPLDYSTLECHSFVLNQDSGKISILEPLLDDFATAVRGSSNQNADDLAAATALVEFVYAAGARLDTTLKTNRVYVSLYTAFTASMFFVNSFVFVLTPLFVRKHVVVGTGMLSSRTSFPAHMLNPHNLSHLYIVGATIYTVLIVIGLVVPGVMGVTLVLGYGTAAPSAEAAAHVVESLVIAARASALPEIVNLAQYYSQIKIVTGEAIDVSMRGTFANLNRVGMFSIVFSVICGYLFLKPVDEEEEKQQGKKTQARESFEV
ncbi:uncharacterized protein SAPINGB_P002140 [Magnusiomyces paraingens]|uniref:Uncharacterized protein n=1 Tax=Magnusiomyces paraingens TaxID=2606893 RepID=A0A5E8BKD3_9ASCO|nr:uncharacterized protein SAPINGB_P002140 [Saprochaete ingens]VVT49175.1 unnamed protein product [Saprochaete ingens]